MVALQIYGGMKMVDKLVIISVVILDSLFLLIGLFMYLIILGGSKNKTDEEQQLEDEEQIKYLKNYKNKMRN